MEMVREHFETKKWYASNVWEPLLSALVSRD